MTTQHYTRSSAYAKMRPGANYNCSGIHREIGESEIAANYQRATAQRNGVVGCGRTIKPFFDTNADYFIIQQRRLGAIAAIQWWRNKTLTEQGSRNDMQYCNTCS